MSITSLFSSTQSLSSLKCYTHILGGFSFVLSSASVVISTPTPPPNPEKLYSGCINDAFVLPPNIFSIYDDCRSSH